MEFVLETLYQVKFMIFQCDIRIFLLSEMKHGTRGEDKLLHLAGRTE